MHNKFGGLFRNKEPRSLIIAIDYDGTYTEDPDLWDEFIYIAVEMGHNPIIVTGRFPGERITNMLPGIPIYYTAMQPKMPYMIEQGMKPDIVIDDSPEYWNNKIPYGKGLSKKEQRRLAGFLEAE